MNPINRSDRAVRERDDALSSPPRLDEVTQERSDTRSRSARAKWLGGALLLVFLLVIGWGVYGHYARYTEAAATLRDLQNIVPKVRVTIAQRTGDSIKIELPGTTEAIESASVNARATGYVARRLVDIGTKVKAGQLLAVIESPELDQQLSQARSQLTQAEAALAQAKAAVNQAKANYDLASVTNARFSKLSDQGWATKQDADNWRLTAAARAADLETAKAAVNVAEANLEAQRAAEQRLEHLAAYEKVVAPFEGVITSRRVDVGDLVNADSASAPSLFTMARTNVLRVRVDIPQSAANGVTDGLPATITVPEMPDRKFAAKIARNAEALATQTRTLLTEVDVDNADYALRPGLYVNVTIDVPRRAPGHRARRDAPLRRSRNPGGDGH